MCEYCGCQALRSIEELTREHDAVPDLVGDASCRTSPVRTRAAVSASEDQSVLDLARPTALTV